MFVFVSCETFRLRIRIIWRVKERGVSLAAVAKQDREHLKACHDGAQFIYLLFL